MSKNLISRSQFTFHFASLRSNGWRFDWLYSDWNKDTTILHNSRNFLYRTNWLLANTAYRNNGRHGLLLFLYWHHRACSYIFPFFLLSLDFPSCRKIYTFFSKPFNSVSYISFFQISFLIPELLLNSSISCTWRTSSQLNLLELSVLTHQFIVQSNLSTLSF